jgi:hypothetical protein
MQQLEVYLGDPVDREVTEAQALGSPIPASPPVKADLMRSIVAMHHRGAEPCGRVLDSSAVCLKNHPPWLTARPLTNTLPLEPR